MTCSRILLATLLLIRSSLSAQTFNPVADTYVRNGTYATRNYGTATSMEVKQSTFTSNYRLIFLKFDLAGQSFGTITSVKLRLYFSGGSSASVSIHEAVSTWTETGLTWNNKPLEGTQLAVKAISSSKVYHEWDVTSFVQGRLNVAQTVFSFVVKDNASGSTMTVSSRQSSSNKPQLVVATTATVTAPSAPSALVASAVSSGQIDLSWADNASNESGFKVESKTGKGAYGVIATLGANIKSYSHTGLNASTAYSYRVSAYNTAGNSAYSNEATATTTASLTNAYYIDAVNGNDANTGRTEALPWKSLSKLYNLTLTAGARVFLKSGSVWTGQQLKFKGSGTAVSPIVIDKYGTGVKPLLHGNGLIGQGVVYLYNQEFIEINNLEVTNAPNGPVNSDFFLSSNPLGADRRGVMVVIDNFGTADHIYLKNLDIHHVKGQLGSGETAVNGAIPKRTGGIFFTVLGTTETTSAKSRFNDILIEGCNIYYCENIGFAIDNEWNVYYPGGQNSALSADRTEYQNWYDRRNTNLVLRSNVIHHIGKNAMIIRMADETGLIERNICYETALGTTGNTMFTARCKGTVFQYNEGYFNRATTQSVNPGNIDGSLYDADYGSVGVIFQYSYSHDNSEGLYWGCNTRGSANNTSGVPDPGDVGCTVRYNISQNDKGDLIFFNYPSAGNEIYNNVFYIGAGLSPNIIHESSKEHTYNFFNNIIYNLSSTADYSFKLTGQTRTISHNIFYGYHPGGDATVAEPYDPYKLTSNPLFVNPGSASVGLATVDGYKLQSTSPAINSGFIITANGGKDFWSNALYSGNPDRGAHEFVTLLLDRLPGRSAIQESSGAKFVSGVRLFPNPCTEYIQIENIAFQADDLWARITDLNGRSIRTIRLSVANSRISLHGVPVGTYILTIRDPNGSVRFVQPFLKH